MPIRVNYAPPAALLAPLGQITGEGQYRERLTDTAQTDAARISRERLSLLDLSEAARRQREQIVARQMSEQAQIVAQQQQAEERANLQRQLAQFEAFVGDRRAAQQARAQVGVDQRRFRQQRILEAQRHDQRLMQGQQGFGFDSQLADQRLQGQFAQAEQDFERQALLSDLTQIDPQSRRQVMRLQHQKNLLRDAHRAGEIDFQAFTGRNQQFDQQLDQVLQEAKRQPTTEEQVQKKLVWLPDPNDPNRQLPFTIDKDGVLTGVKNLPKFDQQDDQKAELEAQKAHREAMADWYKERLDFISDRQKEHMQMAMPDASGMIPPFDMASAQQQFDQLFPMPPGPEGMQAPQQTQPPMRPPMDPAVSALMGGQAPGQQAQAPQQGVQPAPRPNWDQQFDGKLMEVKQVLESGDPRMETVMLSRVPSRTDRGGLLSQAGKKQLALESVNGVLSLREKYPDPQVRPGDVMTREEIAQYLEWMRVVQRLMQ